MSSNPKYNESVLCIPRALFEERSFHGFVPANGRDDIGFYLGSPDGSSPSPAVFIDRNIVDGDGKENKGDDNYKQIIPYIVLLQGTSVFAFDRPNTSNEDRLHGKTCIGVGGHISTEDDTEPFWAYLKGTAREILEETGLQIDRDGVNKTVVGLVNNDDTEVGRLHLGFVHVIRISPEHAGAVLKSCAEQELINPRFIPIEEFANEDSLSNLEVWSGFIAEKLLNDLGVAKKKKFDAALKERVCLASMAASSMASSAAAILTHEDPDEIKIYLRDFTTAYGQLSLMMAGMLAEGDIRQEDVENASAQMREMLPKMTHHQNLQAVAGAPDGPAPEN